MNPNFPEYPPNATKAEIDKIWDKWYSGFALAERALRESTQLVFVRAYQQTEAAYQKAKIRHETLVEAQKALDDWNRRNGGGQ